MARGVFPSIPACLATIWILAGPALAFEVPDARVIQPPPGHVSVSPWVDAGGGVIFPHAKHATMKACRTCHHQMVTKAPGAFVACTRCHQSNDQSDPKSFYRIWHGNTERSCLGCHAKVRRQAEGQPPMGCSTTCHKDPTGK